MAEKKKYRVDAEKFKAARKRAALTVEKLSILASAEYTKIDPEARGFSVSDIQKYEKGGAFIYADKLKILVSILAVRPEEIIFFDEPGRLTDTVPFKTWRYFVEDIVRNSARGYGLYLYGNYRAFISGCCGPSWSALSSASSIAPKSKEETPTQLNAIYSATRKIGLKKKDFAETNEVLASLATGEDETILFFVKDHHIAEIFKRNILKHQNLLQVLKELTEQGEIQYSISEIKQLNEYFTTLLESIDRAKHHVETEKEEMFTDIYGYGDRAEYYRELHEELTYAELDNL